MIATSLVFNKIGQGKSRGHPDPDPITCDILLQVHRGLLYGVNWVCGISMVKARSMKCPFIYFPVGQRTFPEAPPQPGAAVTGRRASRVLLPEVSIRSSQGYTPRPPPSPWNPGVCRHQKGPRPLPETRLCGRSPCAHARTLLPTAQRFRPETGALCHRSEEPGKTSARVSSSESAALPHNPVLLV